MLLGLMASPISSWPSRASLLKANRNAIAILSGLFRRRAYVGMVEFHIPTTCPRLAIAVAAAHGSTDIVRGKKLLTYAIAALPLPLGVIGSAIVAYERGFLLCHVMSCSCRLSLPLHCHNT